MTEEIKYMDIKEFRDGGFLQEANRMFFHPLGLALEVVIDGAGKEVLGNIWDFRDDSEGLLYGDYVIDKNKAIQVEELRLSKVKARRKTGECSEDGIQYVK